MIKIFQHYVTNFSIGLFLTTIKYEMSNAQKEQSLYFVGRKINKWLILGISAAAIVVFVILILFSYKPKFGDNSVLNGVRELIRRKKIHFWTQIAIKNNNKNNEDSETEQNNWLKALTRRYFGVKETESVAKECMQGKATEFSEKVNRFFEPLGMKEGAKVSIHGKETTINNAMDFLKKFSGKEENATDEKLHEAAKQEWDTLRAIIQKRRRFMGRIGLFFLIILPLLYMIFNIALFARHWKDMQKPDREDFATLVTVLITFSLSVPFLCQATAATAGAILGVGWFAKGPPGAFETFENWAICDLITNFKP